MLAFKKAGDSTPIQIDAADIKDVRPCGITRHALNGTMVHRTELLIGEQWERIAMPHADVLDAIAKATDAER